MICHTALPHVFLPLAFFVVVVCVLPVSQSASPSARALWFECAYLMLMAERAMCYMFGSWMQSTRLTCCVVPGGWGRGPYASYFNPAFTRTGCKLYYTLSGLILKYVFNLSSCSCGRQKRRTTRNLRHAPLINIQWCAQFFLQLSMFRPNI